MYATAMDIRVQLATTRREIAKRELALSRMAQFEREAYDREDATSASFWAGRYGEVEAELLDLEEDAAWLREIQTTS